MTFSPPGTYDHYYERWQNCDTEYQRDYVKRQAAAAGFKLEVPE